MGRDITGQLQRFLFNLDLQLEDLKLELSNKTVDLYFDTADARSAILGLHDFYRPDSNFFNRRKFDQAERLVYCLATSDWLGPIQLLPPHQSEFLTLLKLEFGVALERDPVGAAKRFLSHVGLTEMGDRINSVRDISQGEMSSLVRQQAGRSKEFFKAIQSMVPWHKRLPSMLKRGTLQLNPQKIDYEMIISHPQFPELINAFNEERPQKKDQQNLADAIAIIVLSRGVALYKTGAPTLPRIFATSSSFRKVIERPEFSSLLTYDKTPEGLPISAFRNEDYFVFKCTFRRDLAMSEPKESLPSREDVNSELKALRDELSTVLKARDDIAASEITSEAGSEFDDDALTAQIDKIKAFGQPLTKTMSDLQKLSFLENVWLDSSAPQDLERAVRQLVDSAQEVRVKDSKRFKSAADKALGNVKETLTENVRDVEWVMSLWDGLDKQIDDIFSRVHKSHYRAMDYFRDLGLLRYSFPVETHEKIETILRQLMEKGEAEKYARRIVIITCLTSIKDPKRELGNLIAAVAILRAARMDREIVELFQRTLRKLPHFSLKLVYVESMFALLNSLRSESAYASKINRRIVDIMHELERERRRTRSLQMLADLNVGLGYLQFRWWRHQGGEAPWRKRAESTASPESKSKAIIERAISFAKNAYHSFGTQGDKMKQVYALNNYLYYLVEGGPHDREDEIEKAADELTRCKENASVWQYRFDDTLARYYYRRAEAKDDPRAWNDSIQKARVTIELATRDAIRDPDVEGCRAMIDKAIDRGFIGRHPFFVSRVAA